MFSKHVINVHSLAETKVSNRHNYPRDGAGNGRDVGEP